MREFEKACKQLEKMSEDELLEFAGEKYGSSLRALSAAMGGDVKKAASLITLCAMAAASVDGKLSESEYLHIAAMIHADTGSEPSFNDVKELIEDTITGKDSEVDFVQKVLLTIGREDLEASGDFVMFLMAICASDGDASWKERAWIKKLYK